VILPPFAKTTTAYRSGDKVYVDKINTEAGRMPATTGAVGATVGLLNVCVSLLLSPETHGRKFTSELEVH
jgi:hypothetical protein